MTGKRKRQGDDSSTTVSLPKLKEVVVKNSLVHFLQWIPSDIEITDQNKIEFEEQNRRQLIVKELFRYVSKEVSKINILVNILSTLHINYLIEQANQHHNPIPAFISKETYFRTLITYVTTENNKYNPSQLKMKTTRHNNEGDQDQKEEAEKQKNKRIEKEQKKQEEKEAMLQKESNIQKKRRLNKEKKILTIQNETDQEKALRLLKEINQKIKKEEEMKQEEIDRVYVKESLDHVYDHIFRPLLSEDFEFPKRDYLAVFLEYQCKKRTTGLCNLYQTTYFTRQSKVVRFQISKILKEQKCILSSLNASQLKQLKGILNRFVIAGINNYDYESDLLNKVNKNNEPNPLKLCFDQLLPSLEAIINEHCTYLFGFCEEQAQYQDVPIYDSFIGSHPHLFLLYFHYLFQSYNQMSLLKKESYEAKQRGETIEDIGLSKIKVKSFGSVPQLQMKMHFVDLDASSMETLYRFSESELWNYLCLNKVEGGNDLQNKIGDNKSLSIDWIDFSTFPNFRDDKTLFRTFRKEIFAQFFNLNQIKGIKHRNALTYHFETDGQVINTHIQKSINHFNNESFENENLIEENNELKLYNKWNQLNYHTVPSTVLYPHKTVISIDPGHKNIITSVRHLHNHVHDMETIKSIWEIEKNQVTRGKKHSKRYICKKEKEIQANQSVYSLSNGEYHDKIGTKKLTKWHCKERIKCGLSKLDEETSKHCRHTFDNAVYSEWARLILMPKWWDLIWKQTSKPMYQKKKFDQYQCKQRAIYQLARDLSSGDSIERKPSDCILLWGNGSFGVNSSHCGRDSAPNKGLRKQLTDIGFHILVVPEYNTSKLTCCCHEKSLFFKTKTKNQQVKENKSTIYCDKKRHHDDDEESEHKGKSVIWNRDVSGALNIYLSFVYWFHSFEKQHALSDSFNDHFAAKHSYFKSSSSTK
jgi:hypothetical protein